MSIYSPHIIDFTDKELELLITILTDHKRALKKEWKEKEDVEDVEGVMTKLVFIESILLPRLNNQ